MAKYEDAMLRQLRTWPNATETDEVTKWLTDWLVGKRRRDKLVMELARRGLATSSADIASQAFSQWLGHLFRLSEDQRVQAMDGFGQAIAESTSRYIADAGAVQILAVSLHRWPAVGQIEELQQRLSRIEREIRERTDLSTAAIHAAQYVMAARRIDRGFLSAKPESKWQTYPWPDSVKTAMLQALVEALDELPAGEQIAWCTRIGLDKSWIETVLAQRGAFDQALALRWVAWLDGSDEALLKLQKLVDANPADGRLRLLFAQLHTSRGAEGIDESTRLARFVAANTPAGSDLNLAARWQVCKNLIQQGNVSAAREMAELLLASQPLPPSVWRDRFESLTK